MVSHITYDRKFERFVSLADLYCREYFFFVQCIIKKIVDSVFVISGIIKVLVRVISAASANLP